MAEKQTIFVSVTNDLVLDQRVHKVCTFLHENNYSVTLIGRRLNSNLEINRPYKTKRFSLIFTKGPLFYAFFNLRLFFYLLFKKSDVLLANDLDTLLPNYLVSKIKSKKLIYDSHEYFTEVPELVSRPKVQKIWERIEKYIFPKLDTIYTVNQSIAEIYGKKYHKKLFVVRNISNKLDTSSFKNRIQLNIPENKKVIILQGAGINIDRGGEEAVIAMKMVKNAILYIIGKGDAIPTLKSLVKNNGLSEIVIFIDRMPYLEMMNYTFHADLGLSLDKNTNMNYQFSLPNKIFDYLHASTPILATNLIEVNRIIQEYQVGEIIDDIESENLANKINEILLDENKLSKMKENCQKAAKVLNWENETAVLRQIYL